MTPDDNADVLYYDIDEARWVVQEVRRVNSLHQELASLYRTKSRDRRTIQTLWRNIEEGEAGLRAIGVRL